MSEHYTDRLSEYLDGELDANERAEVAAHLAVCDDCARTLAELREVLAAARTLPLREPATDLWPQIAASIGAAPQDAPRVLDLTQVRRTRAVRRLSFTLPQLAVAALGLIAVSATSVWLLVGSGSGGADAPLAADAPVAVQRAPVLTASDRVEADMDLAVGDLERVLQEGRSQLDPQTIRTIEANLRLVDQAIAEARAAVEKDPNSEYLNTYLAESMRRKLSLLRQSTAALRATT